MTDTAGTPDSTADTDSTGGTTTGTAMEAEFDTVAAWTERAVAEVGADHAVPAACRGSGTPSDLTWLAEGLHLSGDDRFLDTGAGLGGPSAWLAEHLGDAWRGTPVLTDPMVHAAAASRRLFGYPALAAWSEQMPLRSGTFEAAWALGVLCTTSDRRALLREVHRALVPGGHLALLVLVSMVDPQPADRPEGNDFPTGSELREQLSTAGFRIDAEIEAGSLPDAPAWWTEKADRVDAVVERDHGDHPAWQQAAEQSRVMGRLIDERKIVMTLLRTTAT